MIERIKTALIVLPIVLLLVVAGGEGGTAIIVAVAAAIGIHEFISLLEVDRGTMESHFAPIWGGLIAASYYLDSPAAPTAVMVVGAMLFFMGTAFGDGPTPDTVKRATRVLASWLYVAFTLGFAVTVRSYGWETIFFLAVLVIVGDSAAYFVGSSIGKKRLAPSISPKKSIEGSAGGFIFTVAAGFFMATIFDLPHGPFASLFIAAAINVAAQVGDLAESLLKRGADIKDSGTIFPGHGGMLDRVDSFIPALPLYAFFLSLTGG